MERYFDVCFSYFRVHWEVGRLHKSEYHAWRLYEAEEHYVGSGNG